MACLLRRRCLAKVFLGDEYTVEEYRELVAQEAGKPRRKNKQPEREQQTAFFDWVYLHETEFPDLKRVWHTPNGPPHPLPHVGAIMQRMGARRGISDLLCFRPRRGYLGFASEFKAPGEVLTPDQIDWLIEFEHLGLRTEIFNYWYQAALFCCWYFDLPERMAWGIR